MPYYNRDSKRDHNFDNHSIVFDPAVLYAYTGFRVAGFGVLGGLRGFGGEVGWRFKGFRGFKVWGFPGLGFRV